MCPHPTQRDCRPHRSFTAGHWLRLLALVTSVTAPPALAAPCADFVDIDAGNAFCSDVQWIRNRAVTHGCTTNAYCPNEPVTRLQMAVFMSRLGNVLQPAFLARSQYSSSMDNAGGTVLCQLDTAPAPYKRVATPSSTLIQAVAGADGAFFARLVISTDQGWTWAPWGEVLGATSARPGEFVTMSPAAQPIVIPAGHAMRFGVQPLGSQAADFYDLHCEVTVRLDSTADAEVM